MLPKDLIGFLPDFLTQGEVAKCRLVAKAWSVLPYTCLTFAECKDVAERFAAAAQLPDVVRSGVRRLSFQFCKRLEDESLKHLEAFPGLTDLNLNGCTSLTDTALRHVMRFCSNLTRLSLYWDVTFTSKGLAAVTESDYAEKLTFLNISGVKHVSDDAVARLVRNCPNLTHLDLTRVEGLRDGALTAIGESCPRLRTLLLYACSHYTDKGLEAIGKGCRELITLDLTGGHLVSDRGIAAIAAGCPNLVFLTLQWVIHLGDPALFAIGKHLKRLRFLSIHGVRHISDAGIEALGKGCPVLETIDVNGTPVTKAPDVLHRLIPSLVEILPL